MTGGNGGAEPVPLASRSSSVAGSPGHSSAAGEDSSSTLSSAREQGGNSLLWSTADPNNFNKSSCITTPPPFGINCTSGAEWEDKVLFKWKVRSFPEIRALAKRRIMLPEPDGVTSPVYVDGTESSWWLRLFPYEFELEDEVQGFEGQPKEGSVGLFLYTNRVLRGPVFFRVSFAALDNTGQPIPETICSAHQHFTNDLDAGRSATAPSAIRNFGYFNFLDRKSYKKVLLPSDPQAGGGSDQCLWLECRLAILGTAVHTAVDDVAASRTLAHG